MLSGGAMRGLYALRIAVGSNSSKVGVTMCAMGRILVTVIDAGSAAQVEDEEDLVAALGEVAGEYDVVGAAAQRESQAAALLESERLAAEEAADALLADFPKFSLPERLARINEYSLRYPGQLALEERLAELDPATLEAARSERLARPALQRGPGARYTVRSGAAVGHDLVMILVPTMIGPLGQLIVDATVDWVRKRARRRRTTVRIYGPSGAVIHEVEVSPRSAEPE